MASSFAGVIAAALFAAPGAFAATFIVSSNADTGTATLRAAIDASNQTPGVDTIAFDLPFASSTISVGSNLPTITDPVVIDGSIDGAVNGAQHVRLDGTADGGASVGLNFDAGPSDTSTVRRLTITDFQTGLQLGTDPVTVAGNFIGTDSGGGSGLGNTFGVVAGGPATIGGETAKDRNVISGNSDGVYLNGSSTFVRGNYIGTDPKGTTAVPNNVGIFVNSLSGFANEIGGQSNNGDANVISGNNSSGVRLDPGSSSTKVVGNLIGTQRDGSSPLGNGSDGVTINQTNIENNRIGSTIVGEANTIAYNAGAGVFIQGAGRGDTISGNSIFSNAGLGIDLAPGGVTPNDPGDADSGPNESQNFPDLATVTARTDGTVEVTGTATGSLSGSFYTLEFFASSSCDPADHGEGARYLGSYSTLLGSFDTGNSLTGSADPGEVITSTATDTFGDTSEFSNCVVVPPVSGSLLGSLDASTDPPPLQNVDLTGAGPLDWAIWGYANGGTSTSLAPDVRKTGASAISSLTNIDPAPSVKLRGIGQFPEPFTFSWASGSGPLRARNATGGVQHDGQTQHLNTVGHGFAFDVPAGVRTRTLKVYVITNRAEGELTATLSDGSAQPYVATLPQAANTRSGVYTITYNAASAGQTLHVQWIETAQSCPLFWCDNAAIHAVALSGPTLVVNSNADTNGSCDAASCTLREAITSANAAGGATIDFAIPGGGPQQIALQSPLPDITVPVSIDGTTEGADTGSMGIVLNGAGAGSADGLVLAPGSDGSTIRGLAIQAFVQQGQAAIRVESDDDQIVGNYIGTDANGAGANGNYSGIVVDHANDNTIGGIGADRNVIGASTDAAVLIDGTAGSADSNTVTGNYIGLDASGQTALPNDGPGVQVLNAANTVVGGPTATDGNVIANNFGEILLGDSNNPSTGNKNVVQNNLIGLTADGATSFPSSASNGVEVVDAGSDQVLDNIIASVYQGIDICGPPDNTVLRNIVGTDALLVQDFGVFNQGISVFGGTCLGEGQNNGPATGNVIGTPGNGNIVFNSQLNNIAVDSNANSVAGNDVRGNKPGSFSEAIEVSGSNNTIGPGNVVRNNGGDGIAVHAPNIGPPGTGDTITQNSIDGNAGLGIALTGGGNNDQAAPALVSATRIANGSVRIQGTLTSAPLTTYRVEYFASGTCDPSGAGEGASFIGFSTQATDAGGSFTIDTGTGLSAPVEPGDQITATATNFSSGDTSAFSACVPVSGGGPLIVNTNADHDDGHCSADDCTLREAINAANATAGSIIDFDLPSGQTTIRPASNLPLITAPTKIDATTQPGYSGTPVVTLDGANVSSFGNGLRISLGGDGSSIRGFVVTDWNNAGIWIDSSNGNTVAGNDVGIDVGGVPAGNFDGIKLGDNSDNNTIGGDNATDRNVISGNTSDGIDFSASEAGAPDDNTVVGNYVGLKPDGTGFGEGGGNGSDGIGVSGNGNVIGDLSGGGNVISGNNGNGINLSQIAINPGVTIRGNLIGTDPSGTIAIGNGNHGIEMNDVAFGQIDHNTISGNARNGIHAFGFDSHDNVFASNHVGTNEAGTAALGNEAIGIQIDESSGTVQGNVISGNVGAGVEIDGPVQAPATFTTVTGNKIGTNAAGTQAIGNGTGLVDSSVSDVIGGVNAGDGNLISGNFGSGVELSGSNFTTLEGNTIGLNADGTVALPNTDGVVADISADTLAIGGSIPGARNVISGNTGTGVLLNGAGSDGGINVVGNFIGTDATGTQKIGNAVGVDSKDSNGVQIGGLSANEGNVIGGNTGVGVHIEGDGSSNFVEGNYIGRDSKGTVDLGNGDAGVHVGPLIHGTVVSNNFIANNAGAGVVVPEASTHTKITANAIDSNAGLGIDLGPTGVTPNDNPDSDGYQNFPTITNVGANTVSGSVATGGVGGQTFDIDVFLSQTCDGSGSGEGAQYLTTTSALTDAAGVANFTANVPALPAGQVVTATATSAAGDTSEFSPCESTMPPPIATNLSLTPNSTSVPAGAAQVKLSDIPPSLFLQPQSTNQAAPVNETPVNETPVNELPVNELPVNETPVNELGFNTLSANVPAFGDIALSSIPLLRPGGWEQLLTGTTLAGQPLQSVTLRDFFALGLTPNPPITLGELDLSNSPLGTLPADALVLANVKLSDMRSLDSWCQAFGPTYCPSAAGLVNETVMTAALQGAPVNETPVNETPVNELPVNEVPVNETPVNEVPVNELPVNETPVNELPVNETPVNETPVNELPVNETPVNELPVNEIMAANSSIANSPVNELPVNELATPSAVIFCATTSPAPPNTVDCTTATLKQAYDAHAIRPNVTLLDLRNAAGPSPNVFDGISIGDLNYYDDITIRDLVDSLPPNTMTLGDYFLLVLQSPTASQGLAWENLNLTNGLSQYSTNGSTVGYRAHFTVQANGGQSGIASPLTVTSTLGQGFVYVPGSSKLAQDPANCSSATPIPDPGVTTLTDGRLRLKWSVSTTVGNSYSICFTARPGIELGPQASSIDATPGGGTTAAATGTPLDVGDTLEPNGNADSTAPQIFDNSFYLSYLTSATDVDYYRFAAPPAGTRVTFHLSHLPADYDLVVYGPPETPLRPPLTGTPPLDEPPVTDSGAELSHLTDPLPSAPLDDLQLQTGLPLVGVSASRGTDPEDVVTVSPGGSGFYTVQVTGYNGATSPDPYMLRVQTTAPRTQSNVPPRTITGTVGPALGTLPTGLNTVFVVNRQQLQGLYGSTGATNVMNALSSDSAAFTSLGFPNVTLSVDRYTAVQNAYTAWNANPGSPTLANAVVAAINGVVDSQIRSQPNGAGLKYLVLVGGDQVIPFARLDDFTVTAGNESSYADTFGTNTDLFSSLSLSQMLSDDPYGTTSPVPYLTRQLYVPNLSVGRLVETPADIVRTLNNFVSTSVGGRLNPSTSLTTGYDFLYDSSSTINGYLGTRLGAANGGSLLDNPATRGDTWTLPQLIGSFLPTTASAPSITSLNGHASHYQFQAPTDDAGVRGGILTTANVTGSTTALGNRLVFSMGCHAGLSVADSIVTAAGASTLDWAQAFAQKGLGGFLGNTGYGYGDTLVTAYSEELNRLFAQNIVAGAKVGDALVAAKQAYYAELGVFGVYDEKAMAEFTLYGLPMWGVANASGGTGSAASLAADAPSATTAAAAKTASAPSAGTNAVITDPTTGLQAETFSVNPTNTGHPLPPPANREYWSGPDGVQVTHLRPIQPKALVGLTGTSAHGALITELTSSDTNCVRPVFDRPVFDLSANEPELTFADVAFPSKVQTVRTYQTPTGRKQQLVLVTGQFFSQHCSSDSSPNVGVQRLFGHIAGRVFSSSSNDFISPAFLMTSATDVGGNAAFTVNVTDKAPGGAGTVKQVLVAVRSGSASNWTFVNLAQSAGNAALWTGGAPITGTQFEYFVQAVDAAGNVSVTTNKGFYFSGAPEPPPPTGGIEASLTGSMSNGWYNPSAGLQITAPNGVTVQVSVDGGPYGPAPATITGDGVHTIAIRASNGGTAELIAPIDTTPPEIVINTPANGGVYALNSTVQADYFCRDSGSGVVTPCTGTVANGANIATNSVGQHTFTVGAITDAAGHTTPAKTVTYTVGYRPILFSSQRTGDGDIYSMNPDGSGVTRLTTTAGLDEQPAWSPDGTKIAFASARNATKTNPLDIYVMDANGQNVTRLTTANGTDTAPSWSPDGRKIAFQSTRDGNPEIYTMNADGSGQTRITNDQHNDTEPAWSANGARIAFVSDRNIGPNVWTMNPDGTGLAQLTFMKQPEIDPAWSPNSSKIMFSSNRAGASGYDLWIMNANGSAQVRVTTAPGDDNDPVFSRDGLKIAFTSTRLSSTNPDIFVANADGTGATRLTSTSGFDRQPDW